MFGMNMWRSPEQAQQLRLQQLAAAATTLATQVEVSPRLPRFEIRRQLNFVEQTSRDKMECANENLRADFERWNQVKSRDLKKILEDMADLHIAMYEQVMFQYTSTLKLSHSNLLLRTVHGCLVRRFTRYTEVNLKGTLYLVIFYSWSYLIDLYVV